MHSAAHNSRMEQHSYNSQAAAAAAGARARQPPVFDPVSPFASASLLGASSSGGHLSRTGSDSQLMSPGYGFNLAAGMIAAQPMLQLPFTHTPFSPPNIGRANSGSHATSMQPSMAYGSSLNWPTSMHLLTPTESHVRRSSSGGGNQSTLHMLSSPIPSLPLMPFGYAPFQQQHQHQHQHQQQQQQHQINQQQQQSQHYHSSLMPPEHEPYATASSPGVKRELAEGHPPYSRRQQQQPQLTPPIVSPPSVSTSRDADSSLMSTATTDASSSHPNSSAEPSFDGRASSGESGENGSTPTSVPPSTGNPHSPLATRVSSRHKRPKHTPMTSTAPASAPTHTRTLDRSALIRQESEQSTSSSVSASPLLSASFSRLSHHSRAAFNGSPSLTTEDNSNSSSPRMNSLHLSSTVASPSPRAGRQMSSSARSTATMSRKASFSSTTSAEDLSQSELDAMAAAGLPLPIPVDGVLTGMGNGSAAGVTIPKPVPGKRGGGFSCHCCKTTKKVIDELFLCTNHLPKNPHSAASVSAARAANEGAGDHKASGQVEGDGDTSGASGSKRCRKKYCLACLKRLYPKEMMTLRGEHADEWVCPSCLNRCSCAGCERKVGGESVGRKTSSSGGANTMTSNNNSKLKIKTADEVSSPSHSALNSGSKKKPSGGAGGGGSQSSRATVSSQIKSAIPLSESPRLSGKRNRSKLKLHEEEAAAAAEDASSRHGSEANDEADLQGHEHDGGDAVRGDEEMDEVTEPSMHELVSDETLFAPAYQSSLLSPSGGQQMTAGGRVFQLPATPPTQGMEFTQYPSAAAAAASGRPNSSPSHHRRPVGSPSPPIASYVSPRSSAAPVMHHRTSSQSGGDFVDEYNAQRGPSNHVAAAAASSYAPASSGSHYPSHAPPVYQLPSDVQRRLIAQQQGITAMQQQLAKLKEEERQLQQPQQQHHQQQQRVMGSTQAPPPSSMYASSSMDQSSQAQSGGADSAAELEMLLLDKHRRLLQQQQMTNTLLQQIQNQKAQHRHMQRQQAQWEQVQGIQQQQRQQQQAAAASSSSSYASSPSPSAPRSSALDSSASHLQPHQQQQRAS